MAFVEPLCAPDTMPGARDTTNSTIVLNLEGVQEPACSSIKWEVLMKTQLGKGSLGQGKQWKDNK